MIHIDSFIIFRTVNVHTGHVVTILLTFKYGQHFGKEVIFT